MIFKFFKLFLYFTTFLFLTGFVHLQAILGPAITITTSGNLVKASAQLVIDNEIKKKTGKSSLGYITQEVSKNNKENRISRDLKELIEKRVKIVHQKLEDQNKLNKGFKLLVEKRVKLTHKKLIQQKINQ